MIFHINLSTQFVVFRTQQRMRANQLILKKIMKQTKIPQFHQNSLIAQKHIPSHTKIIYKKIFPTHYKLITKFIHNINITKHTYHPQKPPMQPTITLTLTHKQTKRQFTLSNRTKPHILKQLIKKSFHFQNDIRYLKHLNGGPPIDVHEVFNFPNENQFEIVLEDESDDKSHSENCSQKNMSKYSGRKHPPSERQLLDSKFYVDDFQLFMSEVNQAKANRYFGIIFFSNRKKAVFLGKKILRELIFEFDKIEFFYALHPIKMHNTSALLGQVLVFSLFKGKRMIHQRQFPQQITAAQEILNYIKNLIKVGQLNFNKSDDLIGKKRSKNLISVSEQRSFDQKNDVLPKKKNYEQKNLTQEFFKIKQVSPEKDDEIIPIRFESPIKSPIANEISFETEFYQPEWFRQGDTLTRIEKSFLSALVKENNMLLINFCQGLELKKTQKQTLNKKLLKVFLDELIEERLSCFDLQQKETIFTNQQNRQSPIFSSLLKLFKFGNIDSFIQTLKKHFNQQPQAHPKPFELDSKRKKSSYLEVAKEIQKNKKTFSIRLMNQNQKDEDDQDKEKEHFSLVGKHSILNMKNEEIARAFHEKPVGKMGTIPPHKINISQQYSQPDIAHIKQLINNNDAFMIQNFIPNQKTQKKHDKLPYAVVKKYMTSIQQRYANLRQRTSLSNFCKNKLHKLQIFMSLLYFIYKQRLINRKQLKGFFYLYIWSDLNVLSAFELYLEDRDLDQMLDTLTNIDYTYYLHGKYGIDMNEVENFTIAIESQLIVLFLLADRIESIENRLAAQKFIRAGDVQLHKIYHDFTLIGQEFIRKALDMCKEKRRELDQHSKNQNKQEIKRIERNEQRSKFIEQIKPAHFKTFTKTHIVQQCIDLDEPQIHSIFDTYDRTNELVKWIDSFTDYIQNLDEYHMNALMRKFAIEAGLDWEKIKTAKPELVKGVYEAYMITTDREDAVDSLQHIIKKLEKDERGSQLSSPTLSKSP